MKNAAPEKPCTKAQAKALTERIREGVDQLWALLLEAHERQAWRALGYENWESYVRAEFDMSRRNSYRLLDQAAVMRELGPLVPHAAQISQRDVAAIKADLPVVTQEIRSQIAAGKNPDDAIDDVIAERRAEKNRAKRERETQQAANDAARDEARAALPESIRRGEEAKARNGSMHAAVAASTSEAILVERDELLEENAALKSDIADRDRRLALFDGIAVQWEKGGFDAIKSTLDDRIRALQRQVEDMSADRASLARSRDFWKKQAFALGYVSSNSQVEAEVDSQADVITDLAPF